LQLAHLDVMTLIDPSWQTAIQDRHLFVSERWSSAPGRMSLTVA
jgi:hypothetical protein